MTDDAIYRELKRLADGQERMLTEFTTLNAAVAADTAGGVSRQRQIDELRADLKTKADKDRVAEMGDSLKWAWRLGATTVVAVVLNWLSDLT